MVQEILSHGGDILKFSGDAFLVLFKVTQSISLPDATHRAIDTAIIIQRSFGAYETEVGVTLRVKIAISAGEVYFSLIGTERFSHYIVIGQPVWKVKLAERIAEAGDIVVNHYGIVGRLFVRNSGCIRSILQLGPTFTTTSTSRKRAKTRCTSRSRDSQATGGRRSG